MSGSCSPRSPFGCSRGRRRARLFPPDFALDGDALRAAITPRAKLLLLNSPHNPTGRVLSRAELETIATACIEHDLICVSDEVYEILGYEGEHLPPATLPGMAERTLTISSVGKSFSFTGWKIGWCSGPAELVEATRTVKPYLTFAGGTQLQHAAAAALRLPAQFVNCQRDELRARRDQLCTALATAGVQPFTPQGTYFVNAARTPSRFACDYRSAAAWSRFPLPRSTTTRRRPARSCGSHSASANR